MNPAPFAIREVTPLTRTFRLFRYLGLRHLPVGKRGPGAAGGDAPAVDSRNVVRGIITRKNLTHSSVEEALASKSGDELRIIANRMSGRAKRMTLAVSQSISGRPLEVERDEE